MANHVIIFKKPGSDILKYSDVDTGMTNKQFKKYQKSNNTLILNKSIYYGLNGGVGFNDLKTLIIDGELIKDKKIEINECSAKDIYINNYKNLGNITIPYVFCLQNDIALNLIWNKKERTTIDKINITFNDSVVTIESKLIEEIAIGVEDFKLLILIENYNSLILYEIDPLGKIKYEYKAREIKQEDIKDGVIDLREFQKYKEVYFDRLLKLNKLIITKDIIKNIDKYKNIFKRLSFNILEIIDDNDMKLFPETITLNTSKFEVKKYFNKEFGNFLTIGNDEVIDVIYLDKKDNLIYLNNEYLRNKYNMKDAKISIDYHDNNSKYLIIIKDNKDNHKVLINEKVYDITENFKNFLILNSDIYLTIEDLNNVYNDNWLLVLGKGNFKCNNFLNIYNDYLKYVERLEKLKELGLNDSALKYLIDRKIHSIINTETDEGLIEIENINKFEIDLFNKMGEEYIKVKSLKRK